MPGKLFGFGDNTNGQLGTGYLKQNPTPIQTTFGENWQDLQVGSSPAQTLNFSIGLKDGKLFSWGLNSNGQLGLGDTVNRNTPTQIGSDSNWASYCVASSYVIAIKTNGQLWAWGLNNASQLGDGTTTQRNSPVRIGSDSDWAQVSSGFGHSLAIKTNGTLWTWGNSFNGATGLNASSGLIANPTQIGTDSDWQQISAGYYFSLAVKNGQLWAWGLNNQYQLGNGTNVNSLIPIQIGSDSNWAKVSASNHSSLNRSMAIKTTGTLWSWGSNNGGATGLGLISGTTNTPTQVGTDSDWLDIESAESNNSLALKTNGTLWSCGEAASSSRAGHGGAGGTAVTTQRSTFGQIGSSNGWQKISFSKEHAAAILNGNLYFWGWDNFGSFGRGVWDYLNTPTQIGSEINWNKIATGDNHTLAVNSSGELWTWGLNTRGQLGNNTSTNSGSPIRIGSDSDWSFVSGGFLTSFAIKTNGQLWAWGANADNGELGDGTRVNRLSPVRVGTASDWSYVSGGNEYGLGIRSGQLWAWGSNSFGKLGTGNTTDQKAGPVRVGTDSDWSIVAAGLNGSAAIKTNGELWRWGDNVLSPTRIGTDSNWNSVSAKNSGIFLAIKNNGELWTWSGTGTPSQIGTNTNWTKIARGNDHNMALKDGELFTWGNAANGRLGNGTITPTVTNPTKIGTSVDWIEIAAGSVYSIAMQTANIIPTNTAIPVISGTVKVGQTLTTTDGTWTGIPTPTYQRQWQISSDNGLTWSNISGETSSTYVLTASEAGRLIRSRITATNEVGSVEAFSTATTAVLQNPTNTVAPAITGTAKVGNTLTASTGTWQGHPTPTYTYQWEQNSGAGWSNISGATSSTYLLTANEAGKTIRVKVTATNSEAAVDAFSSATSAVLQNAVVSTPTISGTAKVGNTLTASATATAGFPAPSISYQWQSSTDNGSTWSNLSGQTNSTFNLTDTQAGQIIRVQATATNTENTDTKSSTPTNNILQNVSNITLPESFGYPLLGELFTTSNGTWNGYPSPTYTYQWQSSSDGLSWSNISGATSSSYTVTENEVGKFIRALVTATNSESSESEVSNSNGPVNQLPEIDQVVINGLPAKVGEELTALASATAGYPEPVITYEWYRDNDGWEFIDDNNVYTPTSIDAGLVLKVVATATNIESSDSSEAITEETLWAPENTVIPTISYPEFLEIGETLTADPGTWTGYPDPAEIGFTYQWQVSDDGENDWQDVIGETNTTLYLDTEFGTKYVRVAVTASTDAGELTVHSAETGYISEDPSIIVSPILSGTPHYQETLTVNPGEWGGFPEAVFTYSWEISEDGADDWQTLDGEEEETIVLNEETVSYYIRAYVTGTNPVGSASVHSNVLGPILRPAYVIDNPTITGDPRLLNQITTDNGSFGGFEEPTFTYGWELSDDEITWQEIDGAILNNYTIPNDEDLIGKYIRSTVTGTNSIGSETGFSNSLGPIDYPLEQPAFTVNPSLIIEFGIPSVDVEIESTYEASGYPVPTPTYQWQVRTNSLSPWTNISGATSATYTPVENNVNKQLRLQVTITNSTGSVTAVTPATFNVVPEFVEPALIEEGTITSPLYINQLVKFLDFGEVSGYPIPELELNSVEFEYSFNSDSEDHEWKTINGVETGDQQWLASEDYAQAEIRGKITYSIPNNIFDDFVIYTNLSGEIIERPYQQQTFLPMANAKLTKIYSNPEITGVPHDSEYLPTYTDKRIKWEGQSDAFIRSKILKLINASTSIGGGTVDRYKETVVIIPKFTIIDNDDYIDIDYNGKSYTWKVIEITDGEFDPGMPEIYRLIVEKA